MDRQAKLAEATGQAPDETRSRILRSTEDLADEFFKTRIRPNGNGTRGRVAEILNITPTITPVWSGGTVEAPCPLNLEPWGT